MDKNENLAIDMTVQAHKQFVILKEKCNFKDEDFNAFAIGYTFGVYAAVDAMTEENK
ncbi:MAG TPA: hypothetical protein VK190_03570 [Pseudoneobacillus sp.]|nr:hypothetical protein [Pseudoneobacillus sp.]